jgi:hypothetical protein
MLTEKKMPKIRHYGPVDGVPVGSVFPSRKAAADAGVSMVADSCFSEITQRL